jgi:hypothetical protein
MEINRLIFVRSIITNDQNYLRLIFSICNLGHLSFLTHGHFILNQYLILLLFFFTKYLIFFTVHKSVNFILKNR